MQQLRREVADKQASLEAHIQKYAEAKKEHATAVQEVTKASKAATQAAEQAIGGAAAEEAMPEGFQKPEDPAKSRIADLAKMPDQKQAAHIWAMCLQHGLVSRSEEEVEEEKMLQQQQNQEVPIPNNEALQQRESKEYMQAQQESLQMHKEEQQQLQLAAALAADGGEKEPQPPALQPIAPPPTQQPPPPPEKHDADMRDKNKRPVSDCSNSEHAGDDEDEKIAQMQRQAKVTRTESKELRADKQLTPRSSG